MESVKVDVQKLQLLNERLVQTLEALNQVRMSMHGIQHTQQVPYAQVPFTPFGYPTQYGFQPGGYPVGYQPFVPGYGPSFGNPFIGGIQHTSASTPTWTPWTQQQWMQQQWQQTPWTTQMPWTPQTTTWGNGISHTPAMTTQPQGPWTWSW